MNISLAIIVQARKNSQRCKNKMLRKFDDSTLFEIQLKKLQKLANANEKQLLYRAIWAK